MESNEKVTGMFSAGRGAKQWDSYYSGDLDSFDKYIFRSRCEYALSILERYCSKDARMLDLGCGAGPFISAALGRGYENCIGTDYSIDILTNAVARLAEGNFFGRLAQSNCEQIPIASDSLDMIVCLGVISYVPDRTKALSEMYRVLKPGGKLLITFRNIYNPVLFDPVNLVKKIFGVTSQSIHHESKGEFVPGAFLYPDDVGKWLENTGFKVIEKKGIGRGPVKIKQRVIFPFMWSIHLDKALESLFRLLKIRNNFQGSDVAIFVCSKSQ